MCPDPTWEMIKELRLPWGPVDERLMEATFHGDPGFFLYCNHGLVYFLWHLQTACVRGGGGCDPNEDYIFVPKAMGFRLDCPLAEKRFTYHYMYYCWYKALFFTLEKDVTLFHKLHFCEIGEMRMVKPGLQLAIMRAREILGRGGHKEAAVRTVYELDWNAVVTEPVPDFADCLFDADEIWADYRLSRAAEKNSRKIDWQCFLRPGYAFHCGQFTVYQAICQKGIIDTDRLMMGRMKCSEAEMLRQHPCHSSRARPNGTIDALSSINQPDYELIAFPSYHSPEIIMENNFSTPTPGVAPISPVLSSTSTSTIVSTPTSASASASNTSSDFNLSYSERNYGHMTVSQISARNAEIYRQHSGTTMPIFNTIEHDQGVSTSASASANANANANADARLWTQYMNDD